MRFATVRMLKNQTSEMLRTAAKGRDVVITSHGRPVAVLRGLSEDEIEDYVLSRHPALRQSIEEAWRHYQKNGGFSADEILRDLQKGRARRRGPLRA
jgi:prevent-host-death family protein